jgi:tetratricopeptide (TPR) repeat protein
MEEAVTSGVLFATLVPNYAESGVLGAEISKTLGAEIEKTAAMRLHWAQSLQSEVDGKLPEAITRVTSYGNAGGDRYFASMRAAWLHSSNKDPENAYKFYRYAEGTNRTAVEAKVGSITMLVLLPDNGKKKDTINSAQRDLLSVLPVDYTAMVGMGDTAFTEKNYRSSETLFSRIHEYYPMDVTTLSYLAWSQYYNKHKKEAADSFTKLLSLSPGHADAEMGLSYSLDRPYGNPPGGF